VDSTACRAPDTLLRLARPSRQDAIARSKQAREEDTTVRLRVGRLFDAALGAVLVGTTLGCVDALPRPAHTEPAPPLASAPLDAAGLDAQGFPEAPGQRLVLAHCTACHSAKLVQQNRATRHGWSELIDWMQRKQGLWVLDPRQEAVMLDYLAAHYGPNAEAEQYRRPPLAQRWLPPREAEASPTGPSQAGHGRAQGNERKSGKENEKESAQP